MAAAAGQRGRRLAHGSDGVLMPQGATKYCKASPPRPAVGGRKDVARGGTELCCCTQGTRKVMLREDYFKYCVRPHENDAFCRGARATLSAPGCPFPLRWTSRSSP